MASTARVFEVQLLNSCSLLVELPYLTIEFTCNGLYSFLENFETRVLFFWIEQLSPKRAQREKEALASRHEAGNFEQIKC